MKKLTYAGIIGIGVGAIIIKASQKFWGNLHDHYDEEGECAGLGENCVFCKVIIEKQRLIYEDELVCVFPDISPKAELHYLIIPKRHIKNLNALKQSDYILLEHMKNIGLRMAETQGYLQNAVLGFHRSANTTVPHLHMHILGMPFSSRQASIIFSRIFFISVDQALVNLKH